MSTPRIKAPGSPLVRPLETPEAPIKTTTVATTQAVKATAEPAPLSETTSKRLTGKVGAEEKKQLLDVGASALGRVTEAVRAFQGLDHLKPYTGKEFPIGERPAQLPKVLARVTQELGAIKEAAAHTKPGEAGFGALMEDFLVLHAAITRAKVEYNYESEGAYPQNMQRLQAKLGEIWALAPAFLGAEKTASLTQRWLPVEPPDLAPVREAAGKLSETIGGYYTPDWNAPAGSAVKKAANLFRDNVSGVDFIRDGGKFAVALSGVGVKRFVSNRGEIPTASEAEVEKAARTLLAHIGLDANVPILVQHPGATPSRTEEAWGVLKEALEARDFIDVPKGGGDGYHLRRWDPTLELDAPADRSRYSPGGKLQIVMHGNQPVDDRDRSFKTGTPSRVQADAESYLWRNGFRDVMVTVTWEPRALTETSGAALAKQLDDLRSTDLPAWKKPTALEVFIATPSIHDMTPREILQTYATKVEVQSGVHGAGREVVVFAEPAKGMRVDDQLRAIEGAVRALTDDPALQGTPIRVRIDAGTEPYQQHSIFFGRTTTEDDRARRNQPIPGASMDRHREWIGKQRKEEVETFAKHGATQASLVADMLTNTDATGWRDALQKNLAAYYLGQGAADAGWQRAFESLPATERTELLALALQFLDDRTRASAGPVAPDVEKLVAALDVSRRLPGRVRLETTSTRNQRTDVSQQAHSDAMLVGVLGGPALAQAQGALAEARRAQ